MTFLTGGFLAGLGLLAVPVVIHLIIRRRRKVMPWGAMQFLMGSPPRFRQRLLKLNELLVLLLRMLAVAAVVLAFAQPLMLSGMLMRRAGENILVIDASLSTSRVLPDGGTAFGEEIAAAEKEIANVGEHDTVRVLVASDSPRWLTPAPLEATSGNREALKKMLRELQPTEGASDMALAIGEALQVLPAADRNARRISIFTDATERPWHSADVTRWKAIQKAASGAPVPTSLEVTETTPPNAATLDNLAISRLSIDHDTVALGDVVQLTAEVKNVGARSSAATEVVWQLDGKEVGKTPLPPLGNGVSTTLEFPMESGKAGSHIVKAKIVAGDALPADNAGVIAIRTLDQIPVLVVDGGRPPNSAELPETGFLLAALGQLPNPRDEIKGRAAFQPKIIAPTELRGLPLDTYLCIVLADVEKIDAETASRLAAQVANGAGLWMALGDRTDIGQFNAVFPSTATGLSPMQLGVLTGEIEETAPGWRILPPKDPHPATMLLGDTKQLDIDKARVRRCHTVLPPIPANLGALLTLETQAPLVIEHSFGKGRVIIQMAPLDRTWNNLPILQAYVPMVREFLWRLADGRVSHRNVVPGETIRVAANTRPGTSYQVKLPDGQTFSGTADDGQVRFSGAFLPGIYRIETEKQAPELFNVPRPALESDLSLVSDATRRFIGEHGVAFGNASAERVVESDAVKERKSIAPYLLAAALVFFLLEAFFTLLFARQRRVRHAAVTLSAVAAR